MSESYPVLIPGQSVMLAHLHPQKMDKRMLRRYMFDKNIFPPLLDKYFNKTILGGDFSVEDIYDAFPQEGIERLMLHLVIDIDTTQEEYETLYAEALTAFQNLVNELMSKLPGEFDKAVYENLVEEQLH